MKLVWTSLAALFVTGVIPVTALAYDVYDGCAAPQPPAHVWFIDAVRGSTPDAAHGGLAVGGVIGTADGSSDHPFNSLAALLHGGKYENPAIPGYSRPLLSSAPYDHYPKTGVNGARRDHDWNPSKPDPVRINPGDMVIVRKGDYGALGVGYPGVPTSNVDAAGATSFVQIVADADARLVTLGVSGARGFVLDGFSAKATGPLSTMIVNVTGSFPATPTQDIVLANLDVRSFDDWADFAQAYTTYRNSTNDVPVKSEQQFMALNFRRGFYLGGNNVAGDGLSCVVVTSSHAHHLYTAFGVQGARQVLVQGNRIDHFSGDGVDLLASQIRFALNQFSSPYDDATGAHPDTFQTQWNGAYKPEVYHDVVIDRNVEIERLDPDNKYPQHITFAQVAAASGLVITGNLSQTSNCPGLALFGPTKGAVIANNTIVGNGQIPMTGCPAVQSGERDGVDESTWSNNVVAGRFYQVCNKSVWTGNVQIPSRQGGKSFSGGLGYCDKTTNTIKIPAVEGEYNGVKFLKTDAPDFAFVHYDPPASGLSTLSDPDLHPVCGGPLASCGPNVGALKP